MTDESTAPDGSGAATEATESEGQVTETQATEGQEAGTEQASGDSTVLTDSEGPLGAPETYADFTMPDGIEVDSDLLEAVTPVFKDTGLSQIQAQKLIDVYASQIQAQDKAREDSYTQINQEWVNEAKSDKEIGGDNFNENVGMAKRAIDKFGTPALVEVLNQTGLGNHPEFIRLLTRVGKTIAEDDPGAASAASGKDRTPAEILYPEMAQGGG